MLHSAYMKWAHQILAAFAVLLAAGNAGALEVKDVQKDLTRVQADQTLTKDYKFRVLSDLSVRRTWMVGDKTRVSLDFSTTTGKLVYVLVEYKKGVSPEKAEKDAARILGSASDISWNKLTKKKAEKYDVKNARAAKSNGFYLFQEMKGKKCVRLSLTAEKPETNRRNLQDASTTDQVTALGSTMGGSQAKSILQDEERRQRTPNGVTGEKKKKPAKPAVDDEPEVEKDTTPATDPEPAADDEDYEDADDATDEGAAAGFNIMDCLEEHNIDNTMLMYAGGGLLGLIVLWSIIGCARRARAKKRIHERAEALKKAAEEIAAEEEENS